MKKIFWQVIFRAKTFGKNIGRGRFRAKFLGQARTINTWFSGTEIWHGNFRANIFGRKIFPCQK